MGLSTGLLACGVGHSTSLDGTDASALDGGSPEGHAPLEDATPGPSDATTPNPAACSGESSYSTAPCGRGPHVGLAPSPGCAPFEQCATGSSCAIDESTCGSASTCLPTASNGGATWDFRIRRLAIDSPPALASAFVQNAIFDRNIDLRAPQCGENGNGAFSWLLRFDPASSTLTTGGAPMTNDPFHTGFCFMRTHVETFALAPQTVCTSAASDGIQSGLIDTLTLPLFVNGQADNVFLLPLHSVQLSRIQLSTDHECIGAFNHDALDSQCTSDPSTCEKWHTGGAVAGYITLEEADTVSIADLSESLCVLLTQTAKGPDYKCVRDANGKIASPGDYCSTTHAAGGCADSFWFGATFAASAVTINDGSGDPLCQ